MSNKGDNSLAELEKQLKPMLEKYAQERDKRLRPDGNAQYIQILDEFSSFAKDPNADPDFSRPARTDEVEVLILGGGFGGLQTGARLREKGVKNITYIDNGADFGGTWYWNRFPGANCDIESYIYLPLLEETGYMPSQKYISGKEILNYTHMIAKHYDLYQDALFQTEVEELRWNEKTHRWHVKTNRGDELKARFVIVANGPMSKPKLPGIPGIQDFKGHSFHTSRWDYNYTGGDQDQPLDKLNDKTVAIIGTGATAVQCVPALGESAKKLYVVQRTPSGVDPRYNSKTDETWYKSQQPGWHKMRVENFQTLMSGVPMPNDLVSDGWTDLIRRTVALYMKSNKEGMPAQDIQKIVQLSNLEKMNEVRDWVNEVVKDPKTAESLKPYYAMFCKRPCFHDEYLPTFNRPNVELIDTDGQGVERITEDGFVVAGKDYKADCIIYATGYEVGATYSRSLASYPIIGDKGLNMKDDWAEDGAKTFHGMNMHGFPNLYGVSVTQGAFTANHTHLLGECATHIAHIISHALEKGYTRAEATKDAQDTWVKLIREKFNPNALPGGPDCTPGYYNNEGQPRLHIESYMPYGGGAMEFWSILDQWRKADSFEGIKFDTLED